jgi:hypothetical protein
MLRLRKSFESGEFLHMAGTLRETVWGICEFTHPTEHFTCTQCGESVYGRHFVCLDDGSDSVHIECAIVENTSYSDGEYQFGPDIDLPVPDFGEK